MKTKKTEKTQDQDEECDSKQNAKILTAAIVLAELSEKLSGLYLPTYESMTVAAAREISRYGEYVDLSDISSMTDEIYRALVRKIPHHRGQELYSGSGMNLSGLKSLPVNGARALSKYAGNDLVLNGLNQISIESAKALGRFGGNLRLNGINRLSAEAAAGLANNQKRLTLNGLKELTPEVAQSLSKHQGRLALSGVESLTPETARAISAHSGRISLNGISECTAETAMAFANHRGYLGLAGLKDCDDALAQAFAGHAGPLSLSGIDLYPNKQRDTWLSTGEGSYLSRDSPKYLKKRFSFWLNMMAS